MGFDAPDTEVGAARRSQILAAARAEFIAHGYRESSLRRIARAAHCSVSNLYGYYPHKDALFCAVVEPIKQDLDSFAKDLIREDMELSQQRDISSAQALEQSRAMALKMVDYAFAHRVDLRLLLIQSDGSSVAGIAAEYVNANMGITSEYLEQDSAPGSEKLNAISDELKEILAGITMRYTLKLLSSDISRQQAELDADLLMTFLYHGYNSILEWWHDSDTTTANTSSSNTNKNHGKF